ncbi:YCII-related domain-containing protein [Mucilaginibacter pineti]|uniref:YCII-related domain-containing protein n=1 Tax=Mucilaginibacter pineti TaxID=1391627 RepID=A0A1G7B3I3_9SPHI|nr:YciI family protein [Mucilaginibacter pineti]SDE20836.1 YCII-related domain-containing protein [Mucilaginibacter pineti]
MKDFLLIFRADHTAQPTGTPEDMQAVTQQWIDWITGIAADNKLTDRGNKLEDTGRVLKSKDIITNGPYTEIKETIGGYTMIKVDSYEDAVEVAKGCPVFTTGGGSVEVREVSIM